MFDIWNVLQQTLTQSQDKAFRRISELKEQSHLDHEAKRHLEENYMLMIEEKDELIKVLKMQVSDLNEDKFGSDVDEWLCDQNRDLVCAAIV